MYTFPKIKSEHPCESYLAKDISESPPIQSLHTMTDSGKRSLVPRPGEKSTTQKLHNTPSDKCNHFGMGQYLEILPESIIYYTISFIEYSERHPTLQLISHGMTSVLTKPELLLEVKHAYKRKEHPETIAKGCLLSQDLGDEEISSLSSLNEILFVVGGKYPTKLGISDEEMHVQSEDGRRIHRRMAMQSNEEMGIMGYDPRKQSWIRFGGDPMQPFASTVVSNDDICSSTSKSIPSNIGRTKALHPLSPFGIVDAKPLYLGYPHYSLLFFGGTYGDTDLPSSRVIGYSFLTAKWELWPDMMQPRHGGNFVVARVGVRENEIDEMKEKFLSSSEDAVVLISCDLELCDCFRCNDAAHSTSCSERDVETSKIGLTCFPSEEKFHNQRHNIDSFGRCEVLDLITRTWSTRDSRAPSTPPDDGGVAVLSGRYVFLPGTCPPPPPSSLYSGTTTCRNWSRCNSLSQLETNSENGKIASTLSSSMKNAGDSEEGIPSSMDIEHDVSESERNESNDDDNVSTETAAIHTPIHTLYYRPGLVYDSWRDTWSILPPRPYVTTSSPTTCIYQNRVLVMGGYRSISENALSCYRHREDDCILDYEDHLDYVWWFSPGEHNDNDDGNSILDAEWTFGGGTTNCGYSQSWASSGDISAAVEAAAILQRKHGMQIERMRKSHINGYHDGVCCGFGGFDYILNSVGSDALPYHAPASVRGASLTIYRGRLTMLGGLSAFSRTFYNEDRRNIWQYVPKRREWSKMKMKLPMPALLDGYSFSLHI